MWDRYRRDKEQESVKSLLSAYLDEAGVSVTHFVVRLRRQMASPLEVPQVNELLSGQGKLSTELITDIRAYIKLRRAGEQPLPFVGPEERVRLRATLEGYMNSQVMSVHQLANQIQTELPGRPLISGKTLIRFLRGGEDDEEGTRTQDRIVAQYAEFARILDLKKVATKAEFVEAMGEQLSAIYGAISFGFDAEYNLRTDHSEGKFKVSRNGTYCRIEERFSGCIFDGVVLCLRTGFMGVMRDRLRYLPRSFLLNFPYPSQLQSLSGSGSSTPFMGSPFTFSVEATIS